MPDTDVIHGFHGALTVNGVKVANVKNVSIKVQPEIRFDLDTLYGSMMFNPVAFTFVCPPIPPETIRYWEWVDNWNDCPWDRRCPSGGISAAYRSVLESRDRVDRACEALIRANANLEVSTRNVRIATVLIVIGGLVRIAAQIFHEWQHH